MIFAAFSYISTLRLRAVGGDGGILFLCLICTIMRYSSVHSRGARSLLCFMGMAMIDSSGGAKSNGAMPLCPLNQESPAHQSIQR